MTAHRTPCPYPDCDHTLVIPDKKTAGTHPCPCGKSERNIRLSWYQQLNPPAYKPMVREVAK